MDCFFNQQISDFLQHIALFFEIAAVYFVWRDHHNRTKDLAAKARQGMLTRGLGPTKKRTNELVIALIVGAIAIAMESYQLLAQYYGC